MAKPPQYHSGALYQLAIGCEYPALQIQIILKSDTNVTPQQRRLRKHRHFEPTDTKRRPQRIRRQQIAHIKDRARISRRCPLHTEHELKQWPAAGETLTYERLTELNITSAEYLELRFDLKLLKALGHRTKRSRRIEVDEFHSAFNLIAGGNVQRCNIRSAQLEVTYTLFNPSHITLRQRARFVAGIRQK